MIIHANDTLDFKEKRRKKRQKKLELKRKKRNPFAQELTKLGHPVVENKEKGGAKNLLKDIMEKDLNDE